MVRSTAPRPVCGFTVLLVADDAPPPKLPEKPSQKPMNGGPSEVIGSSKLGLANSFANACVPDHIVTATAAIARTEPNNFFMSQSPRKVPRENTRCSYRCGRARKGSLSQASSCQLSVAKRNEMLLSIILDARRNKSFRRKKHVTRNVLQRRHDNGTCVHCLPYRMLVQ